MRVNIAGSFRWSRIEMNWEHSGLECSRSGDRTRRASAPVIRKRVQRSDRPVLQNQWWGKATVMTCVIRDEDGAEGDGMRGDHHVALTDRASRRGQLVPNLGVVVCRLIAPWESGRFAEEPPSCE